MRRDREEVSLSSTWSDAVHHSNEGVSISPAGAEIIDLNAQLLGDLGLHPLEQGFLSSDLPFLLGLPGGAALPHGPVVVGPAGVASPLHAGAGETLAELLQDPGVLLDLQILNNMSTFPHICTRSNISM